MIIFQAYKVNICLIILFSDKSFPCFPADDDELTFDPGDVITDIEFVSIVKKYPPPLCIKRLFLNIH